MVGSGNPRMIPRAEGGAPRTMRDHAREVESNLRVRYPDHEVNVLLTMVQDKRRSALLVLDLHRV